MEKLIAAGQATLSVAARVLGFSRQAFYKWRKQPVSASQHEENVLAQKIIALHREDPQFGYRFIADELHTQGMRISERRV